MPFPDIERVEFPILQELLAAGGADHLRYLYDRLAGYFPQLTDDDLGERTAAGRLRWRAAVQRAGRQLEEKGEIRRDRSLWSLTARGRERIDSESLRVIANTNPDCEPAREVSHKEAQQMLVEIGRLLGRHAEAEFDYYDVVWRESPASPRLSHVFEVQIAGSVDSALTRLKHAYDAQRSRPFLVIADERAARFADRRLTGSFHEIGDAITVIGTGELKRLYDALKSHQELLTRIVARD
jgi:hypothetical protein